MSEFVSVTPSGFFGDSPDKIVSVDNFLNKKELKKISSFARKISEWDVTKTQYNEDGTIIYESNYWKDRVASMSTLKNQSPEVFDMMMSLSTRAKPIIDNFFNVDAMPTSPCIVRWLPGQYQLPHADKELHEGSNVGKPNSFPHYDIGCLFYLNDDYEGGELYFPNQNIEFKPKAGSLYFFPGDRYFVHGVKEIKSGIRYTCPMFWTIFKHRNG
jgi:hypothetical protein